MGATQGGQPKVGLFRLRAASTVRAIDRRYLERWSTRRRKPALRQMGVDEIHLGKKQKFLTVVSNLETGEPLWLGRERKKETLDEFFAHELSGWQRSRITAACVDMWEPYRQSIEQWAPQCRIVYGKFHIMQHANAAVELTVDLRGLRRKLAARDFTLPLTSRMAFERLFGRRVKRLLKYALPVQSFLLIVAIAALVLVWLRWPQPAPEQPIMRRFALSTGAQIQAPAVSPNGQHVAYVSRGGLWVWDLDRDDPRQLAANLADPDHTNPSWSPRGDFIAYSSGTELMTAPVSGGPHTRICNSGASFGTGSWNPDGNTIVFSSWTENVWRLYTVSASGGEVEHFFDVQKQTWS